MTSAAHHQLMESIGNKRDMLPQFKSKEIVAPAGLSLPLELFLLEDLLLVLDLLTTPSNKSLIALIQLHMVAMEAAWSKLSNTSQPVHLRPL